MSVSLGTSWENDFENAISGNSVGLMFFDENYRLRRLTDLVIKAGFIDESALGLLADEINFPLSYRSIAHDIHKAGSKKTSVYREILYNNKAWVFRIKPYVFEDNHVCGVTVVMVDITQTKTLETRTHTLMKNMSVAVVEGLFSRDTGLELLNVTESMSMLLGYTEEEYENIVKTEDRFMYLQEMFLQLMAISDVAITGEKEAMSQFRMRRKDGRVIWIEARGEVVGNTVHRSLLQFVLIDITRSYEEQEKLRLEKKKFAYIIEMTSDTLFEYNIANDVMILAKQKDESEIETSIENYASLISIVGNTHPDDEEIVSEFADALRGGARVIKSTFRRKMEDNQYHWLRFEGRTIYTIEGNADRIVGRITNVDEEKNREAELIKSSERDPLTGLYNHMVCIEKIKKQMARIKSNEAGYLVVIDVDNFKRINDENGHLYGDAALCSLSDAMKVNFPTGIKGRIGGDEFMVFVKGIEVDELKQKLSNVLNEFSKLSEDNQGSFTLSCSMGVAVCRKDTKDYERAFETADRALYLIKETGKNSYTICEVGDDVLEDGHRYIAEQEENDDDYDKESALISSDDDLIVFALELMSSVNNYRKGLGIVADRVCSYVGFDEMALITSSADSYAVNFDWTGDKAHPYARKLYPRNQRQNWGQIEEMFTDQTDFVVIRGKKLADLKLGEYASILVARLQASEYATQYIAYIDKTTDRSWEHESEFLIRLTHMLVSKIIQMQNDERNREEIEYRINYDALTGLPSYTKFLELAEEFIKSHVPSDTMDYYVCYGDFVNFNYVNELYGYNTGDHILELTGKRLQRATKVAILSSRITGDQFVGLCEIEKGVDPGSKLLSSFSQFNDVVKMRYPLCKLTVICGMCKVEDADVGISVLVDRANAARKYGKEQGENGCVHYTREMWERNEDEKQVYVNINDALNNREFQVYLQPKISLKTGKIVGAESLVRWRKPDGTLFSPDRFIPILEKNGFITKVDYYVLEETLRYLKELMSEGIEPIPISVNFSRVHYDDPLFAQSIMEYLQTYEVDPGLLEAEVTEYNYLHDIKSLNPAIIELQKQGVLVSIDDFGSGYSSLNILSKVTADIIKLDRLFLEDMDNQKEFITLLAEMINRLGYQIIMEGVETEEQMKFIATTKCDLVQGYFVSRPMPMQEFKAFLLDYNSKAKPWK